jgi:hypothetical protein
MRGSAMNPSGSFGSLADILQGNRNVRFTPESGHQRAQRKCLLSANSGHRGLISLLEKSSMR